VTRTQPGTSPRSLCSNVQQRAATPAPHCRRLVLFLAIIDPLLLVN
jgi:hypothetical protein